MRIFGSESMNNILEKLGLKDGESIDHPWINKALERAQQKVEARNFDIRKSLLKFDDVLNDQRHVIFSQRRKVIESLNAYEFGDSFLNQTIEDLIEYKNKNTDFDKKFSLVLGVSFDKQEIDNLRSADNKNLKEKILSKFKSKRDDRIKILGEDRAKDIEKRIFLQLIDQNWKMHIQYLEQLRQVIGLRSYGQRDPLIEYKKEAFNLFEELLDKLKTQFIGLLLNIKIVSDNLIQEKTTSKIENTKCLLVVKKGEKIPRNEICPATNKKYKNCCGAL